MGFCFLREKEVKKPLYLIEEKEELNQSIGLKIHICGNLPEKNKITENLFHDGIDINHIDRGTHQYKTNQFHWIAKVYQDSSEETINSIINEITEDIDNNNYIETITQNVILFFGEENVNLLFEKYKKIGSIHHPLFIIISKNEIKIKFKDKRRITNIILNEITSNKLNSLIISTLWRYDCYYNEKGNKICRYSPDNIFKSFDTNLSFYSINILLTGKSRAGKSTFINYLTNKLNALESSKKETVSKKITEYYIYLNNKDNTSQQSCIKIFDTPGIVYIQKNKEDEKDINKNNTKKQNGEKKENKMENLKDNEKKDFKELLTELLSNKNNMENQIHFVLFFSLAGESLEGIDEIFKLLNDCQKPVFFVFNKAPINEDDDEEDELEDISSTISFMKKKSLNNLTNKSNYFGINLERGRGKDFKDFGVNNIFKRIYQLFIEKNKLNEENEEIKKIKDKMDKLYKKYKKIYKGAAEMQDFNDKENFKNEVNDLKNNLDNNIEMFKNIDINIIKDEGIKSSNKCRNVINSLANLSKVLINVDENDLPTISYFQAFMVREIGEIFGFNLKEIKNEIDDYFQKNISNYDFRKILKNKKNKIEEKVIVSSEIINDYLKSEIEKSKDFIIKLAKMFNGIRQDQILSRNPNENQIDKTITNEIFTETIDFLIEDLNKSNGLLFYQNYLNICQHLEKDLKCFSELDYKKQWGNKEMIIIKE